MNKKNIILIAAIVLVAGVVFFLKDDNPKQVVSVDNSNQKVDAVKNEVANNKNEERIVISGHKLPKEEVVVSVGTTVIFENRDSFAGLPYSSHTITTGEIDPSGVKGVKGIVPNSGSGEADGVISVPLGLNDEFSYTFDTPGVYTFYIAEHPNVSGQGKITVRAVDDSTVKQESVISMESGSFLFTPNIIKAKVGEMVKIDINSVGQHTFTIDELGVNVLTPHGKTTRVEFTPDKKGTFTFYCAIPGHRESGQVGTIVIE